MRPGWWKWRVESSVGLAPVHPELFSRAAAVRRLHNCHHNIDMTYQSELLEKRYRQLQYWLTLDQQTDFFFFPNSGSARYASILFMPVMMTLAIVFTPYILWVLATGKKYGWLVAYFMMIGLPIVLTIGFVGGSLFVPLIIALPLLMFYAYCWMLRIAVQSWISD